MLNEAELIEEGNKTLDMYRNGLLHCTFEGLIDMLKEIGLNYCKKCNVFHAGA